MELELCSQKLKVSLGCLHDPVHMRLEPNRKVPSPDRGGSPADPCSEACWQHKRRGASNEAVSQHVSHCGAPLSTRAARN